MLRLHTCFGNKYSQFNSALSDYYVSVFVMDLKECYDSSNSLKELCVKYYGKYSTNLVRKLNRELKVNNLNADIIKERYRLSLIIPRLIKTCPVCNKTFETLPNEDKITCGYSCSNVHFNGVSRNINVTSYKVIAFRKHKRECIICGENKIVEVHHYDEDHENNNWNNLIPMCPTHHQYFHSKYKYLVKDKIESFHKSLISE